MSCSWRVPLCVGKLRVSREEAVDVVVGNTLSVHRHAGVPDVWTICPRGWRPGFPQEKRAGIHVDNLGLERYNTRPFINAR